ncbi:efflux transporter outer membrane subunit [Ramlibacter sp. G-1-2-2]|uniref:Efflux transporter outer membrane subunit n=1 Tax=Ramlibacter agri TaxID=2728837 RepID=A0A848H887_9BURK|nr:efflux transporter outer membrane subunit [Ramlibacter agri]NML46724.1 efflux transporter outer membrane subunit [Ramlibacter agri]
MRLASLSAATAAALFLLAGCATTQPPAITAGQLPARWDAPHTDTEAAPAPDWWMAFGSSQLDALITRGVRDGFDLAIARQRLEQARGQSAIARAGLLPALDAAAAAARGTSSVARTASLQASMDLDFAGGNAALRDSAAALVDAAVSDVDAARSTVAAAIANGYFQVLCLDERIRLARLIADSSRQTLQLVETQARLGATSQLEVEQQRNALQTVEATVPALAQQRAQAVGDLAVLLGAMPEGFGVDPEGLQALQVPDVPATSPADAIARLPQVRTAEAQLRSANFDVAVARAAFLPKLTVSATLGAAFNPAQAIWSLAGSALQPLFDGGQRAGQLDVDRARAEELVLAYRKAIAQGLQTAETQMHAVAATRDTERIEEAAVVSARRALELSRVRLQYGTTDFLNVLLGQRTLYQAEDAVLQTRLQRLQAAVSLYVALGAGQPAGASLARTESPTTKQSS